MLYIVNREDADTFSPAKEIDPIYAKLLKQADEAGVEILVYRTKLSEKEIYIDKKIKVEL
jgi:sugar fermentation stimulation protein A